MTKSYTLSRLLLAVRDGLFLALIALIGASFVAWLLVPLVIIWRLLS